MMKRLGSITATVALVTGLSVGAALAQAPLGLSINPTHGIRGDVVNAQVNTDDIAANCYTNVADLQADFDATAYYGLIDDSLILMYWDSLDDFPDTIDTYQQLAYLGLFFIGLGIHYNVGGAADQAFAA
jgi:hypothetical protein